MNDGLALRVTYALSRVVFFILFSLLGLRRAVIRDNLARSFPSLAPQAQRGLRREFLRRQCELAAEVLLAPRIDPGELRERVARIDERRDAPVRLKVVLVLRAHDREEFAADHERLAVAILVGRADD